ncbi:DUF2968 domain-containing protein [Paraburkholderia susongensis]|uniref:DUF2968 family protein n=1 Tax=Paraburkholderia susongensis TaxID=1515439 RepID=A0A1X7IPH1_9BURK|nr:DUF2968 domain-containing protein [Paraburkholderia susongensis]SMG16576.1 Protein of unknown function [Paraburkholderia susongensis]
MRFPLIVQRTMLVAGAYVLWHAGAVQAAQDGTVAPVAGTRPAMSELTPQPGAAAFANTPLASSVPATPGGARGDVAELMQLIHDANLNELRTTYNGNYGASLFFHPSRMTYYIALFQDKHFWRVIKSEDVERAEAIYANFAQQTTQLADVEIRRTRLQAQTAYLQGIIATSQEQAQRLQADLDVARTQQAKADDYQRQARGEALTLHAERDKAQAQLRQVQSEITQLRQQTEAGLPVQK